MTDSPLTRDELLPHLGLPVHVQARIARVGAVSRRGSVYQTLLINQITVSPDVEIDHAWLTFGPTGSARIIRLRRAIENDCPIRLDAKVAPYATDGLIRLGLADPHNAEVQVAGRWKCLIRGIEPRLGDNYLDHHLDDDLFSAEREHQRPVAEALRALPRPDKAARQMLSAYWLRGELLSAKQLAHAQRITGCYELKTA